MSEPLALTLAAAAEALSVSPRTVRRLLDAGDLASVRIGRALRVSAVSVRAFVERAQDQSVALRGLPKSTERAILRPWHAPADSIKTGSISAPTRPIGGQPGPTAQAAELGALLGLPTDERPKRSSPGGDSRRTAARTPKASRSGPSMP
jgi:excisionase family DNA binding protein